jgi:hypothetical protein
MIRRISLSRKKSALEVKGAGIPRHLVRMGVLMAVKV